MTDRRRDSVKARRICYMAHRWQNTIGRWRLTCHVCKNSIDPIRRTDWRADHIRRWAEGGEDTPENLWPICTYCDVTEKAPQDTREVAKGKRVRDNLYVGKPKSKLSKPKDMVFDWKRKRWVKDDGRSGDIVDDYEL
jgi:hypothetical protein